MTIALWFFLIVALIGFAFGTLGVLAGHKVRPLFILFVAALSLGVTGFLYGQRIGGRDAEIALQRARIETLERDVAVARTAEADATVKAEAQEIYAETLEKQVADYENENAATPNSSCLLNDNDVNRLRNIR